MQTLVKGTFVEALFKTGICVGLLGLLTGCGESSLNTLGHKVSLSLHAKSDLSPFFARYATSNGRVLVREALPGQSGHEVVVPQGKQLYMTEFMREGVPFDDQEVFREGRLVFYVATDLREATIIANRIEEFAHPRAVNLEDLKHPSATLESSRNEAVDPAVDLVGSAVTIDAQKMREDLESLSGARPVTIDGATWTISNRASTEQKTKARAWLKSVYERLGFTVSEHRYATGANFIAERKATSPVDDQIVLVSGHLDTVQTAGADDDGAGVISSLSVARAISQLNLKRTVRFVAFDEEEKGLIGSANYAKELVRTGEIAKVSLFNIEMSGYDSDNDGGFHAIDCDENTSATLTQAVKQAISQGNIALKYVNACTNRSDHAAFWEYNRPAIVVSQNFFGGDSNPCYHRTCDTVAKVNWDYMSKITQASANALVAIIGSR